MDEDISLTFPGDYLVLLRRKTYELKGTDLKKLTSDDYLSESEFTKLKKNADLND